MRNSKIEKYIMTISLLLGWITLCLAQLPMAVPDTVTRIIQQTQQKYCPDKRIARFEVAARFDGQKIVLTGETLSHEGKTELISRLREETNFPIEDSLLTLPDPALGKNTYGLICVSVGQLRRHPDVIYEIISQALLGTEVRILKIEDRFWAYCQLDDGYLGWMMLSSIKVGDSAFVAQWRQSDRLIVTSNYGQIWAERKEQTISVSDVVRGNLLLNLGQKRGWNRVQLPDGRSGYIRSNLVMEEKKYFARSQPTPSALVNLAFQFIGIPYLWGGRSTKGFDCSGFTQTLYQLHGLSLPRDANMQVKIGHAVALDDSLQNLKTGDLLFFGRDLDHITHVGMYIGKGKFIHADGWVHINSFNPTDEDYSRYRRRGLQAARRILTGD
ncbi:MAG: C40 family peptidase [candidate division KSB1 bacterium]|nr:C40 family peptidase [candidate division KSB1 bacterium]MDZ7319386.1 C40 family peptidase [candidate division KSB1 bacterium]MDZ7342254.1 C40 family peptidase [candidate division KSB1 bacterium]